MKRRSSYTLPSDVSEPKSKYMKYDLPFFLSYDHLLVPQRTYFEECWEELHLDILPSASQQFHALKALITKVFLPKMSTELVSLSWGRCLVGLKPVSIKMALRGAREMDGLLPVSTGRPTLLNSEQTALVVDHLKNLTAVHKQPTPQQLLLWINETFNVNYDIEWMDEKVDPGTIAKMLIEQKS